MNTRNNDECNYRMDKLFNPDQNAVEWNINGTNEYEYVNTKITAVVYENGDLSTSDQVVGKRIIGNLKGPLPKISDISRNDPHSAVFGMSIGVKWSDDFPSEESDVAFYGKCSRMILNGFSWPRMKCYNSDSYGPYLYQEDLPLASQNTAIISDIDWGCLRDSLAMTQLREAANSNNGKLQMRISTHYHTQNYPPFVARNATLGYIVGVIGVANENDTDNIPGERGLFFKDQPIGLKYDTVEGDLCFNKSLYDFGNWSNFAPSMVDYERNEVHVDLSNSIPTDMSNTLRSIGTLRLGVLLGSCVLLVGNESAEGIPYSSPADLPITSAIYTVHVDSSLMDKVASNPLVVVQMVPDGQGNSAICTGSIGGPEPKSYSRNFPSSSARQDSTLSFWTETTTTSQLKQCILPNMARLRLGCR